MPRYPFQFRNSANTFQFVPSQIMEIQPEYETDSGRHLSRADDIILPTDNEFRVTNIITHSL